MLNEQFIGIIIATFIIGVFIGGIIMNRIQKKPTIKR
jgi:hypothetical protein